MHGYGLQSHNSIRKSRDMPNVIKLNSKTRPGIKMECETAWEKALCRLFFGASKEISVQQTKRMEYPLKKMFM